MGMTLFLLMTAEIIQRKKLKRIEEANLTKEKHYEEIVVKETNCDDEKEDFCPLHPPNEKKEKENEENKKKEDEEKQNNKEEEKQKEEEEEKIQMNPIEEYYNETINLSNFNFNDSCGTIFKYKPHNKRDLVFHAVSYKYPNRFLNWKEQIYRTQSLTAKAIPNATRILFLYGPEPEKGFIKSMEHFGLQVIQQHVQLPTDPRIEFNAAVERYPGLLSYLKQHKDEYDRVVISDFGDVMWFSDGFACFSENDIFITKECSLNAQGKLQCTTFKHNQNYEWLGDAFGYGLADQLKKQNSGIINVGFAAGGTEKMIAYLEEFVKVLDMHRERKFKWGYDQAIINYMFYTGIIEKLNIRVLEPGQFFAFDIFDGLHYNEHSKSLMIKGSICSPVVRHKIEKDIKLTK